MNQLFQDGILILGGSFDDASGGQSVIKVKNMDEAIKIMEKDPAIIDGVFSATIHPWLIAFDKSK